MGENSQDRQNAIRHSQNELLYDGIKYSAAGSLAASAVVLYTFGPLVNSGWARAWFMVISVAYLIRLIDLRSFRTTPAAKQHPRKWAWRFNFGALLASAAWASSMWVIFPLHDIPHQILLIMTLGGVAGGALASLPYDRLLNLGFQLIILLSVELRLLMIGNEFSMEIALFSLFVFGFLLSCGKEVGNNYLELIRLKQDIQDKSSSVMQTTERIGTHWVLGMGW